jgi:hypothetical protein
MIDLRWPGDGVIIKQMVWRFILTLLLLVVSVISIAPGVMAQEQTGRLITVYDRGTTRVFLTR